MNAQKLGSPKVVKISSWIYGLPVGISLAIILAIYAVNGSRNDAAGDVWLLAFAPVFLFFTVATPVYVVILAAYASAPRTTPARKALAVSVALVLAGLWIWQVPPRFLG